ncbi:hypothetical protein ACLK1S_12620 [Escherichia coli]
MRVAYLTNWIAMQKLGLKLRQIIEGICSTHVLARFNNPSFGYGGYCFQKY